VIAEVGIKKRLTWTKKLSDQLNAHVARKKEETETNKRHCPLSSVHVQDPEAVRKD